MKLHEILNESTKTQQIDEGFIQDVFNFLWNTTGKVLDKMPVIGDRREQARIKAEYDNFVESMDDATIDRWIGELTADIKSKHPATARATEQRTNRIRKQVQRVKDSQDAKQFLRRMSDMRRTLQELDKYINRSNLGVMKREKAARRAAKSAAAEAM